MSQTALIAIDHSAAKGVLLGYLPDLREVVELAQPY